MRSGICVVIYALVLAACGGGGGSNSGENTPTPVNIPTTTSSIKYFGYSAIACDHDDPLDNEVKIDYSDEVSGFTNANQVCVTGDFDALATRLSETAAQYTPVFYIEPVFFQLNGTQLEENPNSAILWNGVKQAITNSGVSPDELIFYIVDEPTHRGLDLSHVATAIDVVKTEYPNSKIMMIEAYHGPNAPTILAQVDLWGFNAYTIEDPAEEPLYTNYLDMASERLEDHQSLVMIMDANHTPIHEQAGLSETDMADVATNYLNLAQSRTDISMVLGYTWAGGIDHLDEKGIRNLPESVQERHREIGRLILGN